MADHRLLGNGAASMVGGRVLQDARYGGIALMSLEAGFDDMSPSRIAATRRC